VTARNYHDCSECGGNLEAIFFCIHCAERFCCQECFRRHATNHVTAVDPPAWAALAMARLSPEWDPRSLHLGM
jgi:hypothetical protein